MGFIGSDRIAGSWVGLFVEQVKRVLVVDDEQPVRAVLVEIVRAIGHVAIPSAGIANALWLWDADGRSFDVAIRDYHLTDGFGAALARRLINEKPALRVILTSGMTEANIEVPAGVKFLGKPF